VKCRAGLLLAVAHQMSHTCVLGKDWPAGGSLPAPRRTGIHLLSAASPSRRPRRGSRPRARAFSDGAALLCRPAQVVLGHEVGVDVIVQRWPLYSSGSCGNGDAEPAVAGRFGNPKLTPPCRLDRHNSRPNLLLDALSSSPQGGGHGVGHSIGWEGGGARGPYPPRPRTLCRPGCRSRGRRPA